MDNISVVGYILDCSDYRDLSLELKKAGLLVDATKILDYSFNAVVGLRLIDLDAFSAYTVMLSDLTDDELDDLGMWFLKPRYKVYTFNVENTINYSSSCGYVLYDLLNNKYSLIANGKDSIYEDISNNLLYTFVSYPNKDDLYEVKDSSEKSLLRGCFNFPREYFNSFHADVRIIADFEAKGNLPMLDIHLCYSFMDCFYITTNSGCILWASNQSEKIKLYKNPNEWFKLNNCKVSRVSCHFKSKISSKLAERFEDFIRIDKNYIIIYSKSTDYRDLIVPSDCECLSASTGFSQFKSVVVPPNTKIIDCPLGYGSREKHKGCTMYIKKGSPASLVTNSLLSYNLTKACEKRVREKYDSMNYNEFRRQLVDELDKVLSELSTVDDVLKFLKNKVIKIVLY